VSLWYLPLCCSQLAVLQLTAPFFLSCWLLLPSMLPSICLLVPRAQLARILGAVQSCGSGQAALLGTATSHSSLTSSAFITKTIMLPWVLGLFQALSFLSLQKRDFYFFLCTRDKKIPDSRWNQYLKVGMSLCVCACVCGVYLQFFMPSGCRPFSYKAQASGVVQGSNLCREAINQEES